MSKGNPRIQDGNSQRNADQKDKEDYATNNYPTLVGVDGSNIQKAEAVQKTKAEEEKKVVKKPKNSDFNYIDDQTFLKELAYLPFVPQSDLILLLGPRIKPRTVDSAIKLSEREEQELLKVELDKLAQGFRVLAISKKAFGVSLNGEYLPATFDLGDYAIYKGNIFRLSPDIMSPESDDLGYYQVKYMDIQYTVSAKDAERFKPKQDDQGKGE